MQHASIRPLTADASSEIELIALRMRRTLEEVLGEERGRSLYDLDWLRDRVLFHLDRARSTGCVLLAERHGQVIGHTIVRLDSDDLLGPFGLFSTTYVEPAQRRLGIGGRLVDRGESWLIERGARVLATDTAARNARLIGVFVRKGYAIELRAADMVRLVKRLR